jgi:GNAT superfamily N-acetyltransferase
MIEDLRIEFLEDNRHLFSILEESYETEWKEYYGPGGQGNALSDINSFCKKHKLPICLVALKRGSFTGTVALKQKSASHHHLGPWVTSLFVIPEERRKGIRTKLIEAVEILSANLGFSKLYSRSASATEFFKKIIGFLLIGLKNQN